MNIDILTGNLRACTPCLGVKCCSLIGHLWQLLSVWLHMYKLSFTPTSWPEFLSFRSVVYAWPLPKATSTTIVIKICTTCGQPAIDDLQQTRNKLPCVLQLQSSQLQVTDAALWQKPFMITYRVHELDLRNYKILTRYFKIYCIWLQASKYAHARVQCSPAHSGSPQKFNYSHFNTFCRIWNFGSILYVLVLFGFWMSIVNFLIFALILTWFWNEYVWILNPNWAMWAMNIDILTGNLRVCTPCLGVKCCSLIGHLWLC